MRIWPVVACLMVVAGAARAQPTAQQSIGPVQCFEYATDIAFMSDLGARQLCLAATSDLPARCAQAATEPLALTDLQVVRLCQGATSLAPADCALRLDVETAFTQGTIVSYCAALRYPLVPAQSGGSPTCIEATTDRTTLSDTQALRLCAGSQSTAPLVCYEWGDDRTTISDDDLVELCSAAEYAVPYTPLRPYSV